MDDGSLTARVAKCLDAIDEARAQGMPWEEIGDRFGTSRTGVRALWSHAKVIRAQMDAKYKKLQDQFEQEPMPPVKKKRAPRGTSDE